MKPFPATAVPWCVAFAGIGGLTIGAVLGWLLRTQPALALAALLACTGVPMWLLEWQRHRSTDRANHTNKASQSARGRSTVRAYGLLAATAIWAITLNVLPLARGNLLSGFWQVTITFWPLLALAATWYLLRPSTGGQPQGLELAGRWLLEPKRHGRFPWHVLRDQLVKAFFLPLMISFAYNWTMEIDSWNPDARFSWYYLALALLYLVDTAFATIGYLSTSQRLDAHIRSSNPYWSGWIAAMVCYPPFFTWLQQAGFNYRDGLQWTHWLDLSHAWIAYAWGLSILVLSLIYALSTAVFGIRFSNLTHRGIITHGPYRWSKHPAYISKNLSWWMISVPFVSEVGTATAITHCGILLCMNGIYWVRAKTEEKHLMQDPVYRDYAMWVAEYGLFARLFRMAGVPRK